MQHEIPIITDAEKWNEFTNDLDKLIPEGAIVAFALDNCPNGWTPYTWANGRFLMGASSDIWGFWWKDNIKLSANQLPPHQHKIKYRNRDKFGDDANRRSVVVDRNSEEAPEGVYLGAGNNWTEKNFVQTASFWNNRWTWQDPVNITNSYVKVRFCVKWNYTINEDSCPSDYRSDIPRCDPQRNDIEEVSSLYGTMTCKKCTPACNSYTFSEFCRLPKSEIYQWGNGVVSVGFDGWTFTCVKPGCCGSKMSDFTESFSDLVWTKDQDEYLSNVCR